MQQECKAWTMHALSRAQNWLGLWGTFMEAMEAKHVNSNLNKQNTKENKTKLKRNQEDKLVLGGCHSYLFTDLFDSGLHTLLPTPLSDGQQQKNNIQTCICLYRDSFVGVILKSQIPVPSLSPLLLHHGTAYQEGRGETKRMEYDNEKVLAQEVRASSLSLATHQAVTIGRVG